MTKLSTIANTQRVANEKNKFFGKSAVPTPTDLSRVDDSPRRRARKVYINPTLHSEGELMLKLIAQELQIESQFFGDPNNLYAFGKDLIYNATKNGLHRSTAFVGQVPNELKGIVNAINVAKRRTKNAAKSQQIAGYAGIGMFDPFGDDPLVDLNLLCADLKQQVQQFQVIVNSGQATSAQVNQLQSLQTQLQDCLLGNSFTSLLNDRLEESSHDFMYNFLGTVEIQKLGSISVGVKSKDHKTAITKISQLANVSRDIIDQWMTNGIKRQNVQNGTQPLGGSRTSYALFYEYQTQNGIITPVIGEPLTIAALVTLAKAVAGVLAALTAAIVAAKALVESLSPSEDFILNNSIAPPGSFEFNPDLLDAAGIAPLTLVDAPSGSDTANNGGNNNGLLIGGVAALVAYAATR